MANEHLIRIPRQPDRSIVALFTDIASEQGLPHFSVNVGSAGSFNVASNDEESPELEMLLKAGSSLIESADVPIPGFGIAFHRGGYNTQPKSAIFDDIRISANPQQAQLSEVQRLTLLTRISKALGPFDPERTVTGVLSPEQEQLLAIHSSTLERLEQLNTDLVRDSEAFRRNVESD